LCDQGPEQKTDSDDANPDRHHDVGGILSFGRGVLLIFGASLALVMQFYRSHDHTNLFRFRRITIETPAPAIRGLDELKAGTAC
jgi:hypothetical protein